MSNVVKKIISAARKDIKKSYRSLQMQSFVDERDATNLAFARSLNLTDEEVNELLAWDLERWRDAAEENYIYDQQCSGNYSPAPFNRESIVWPWIEESARAAALSIAASLYADRRPKTRH